jgi:flagellar basal-body rod protein FlgF
VGPTLFRAGNQAGIQFVTGNVSQGVRESSNVNSAQAMVEMIAGSRYFEAAQRALRTLAESIQLNTRPQT